MSKKTSRTAAQWAGDKYYAGKECPHGHGTLRLSRSGRCAECARPALTTSRRAAQLAMEKHYLGQECPRGHGTLRYASNGTCVECAKHPPGVTRRSDTARGRSQAARAAAEAKGELCYTAADPCLNGHFVRYVSNGACVECQKVRQAKWNASHPTYHIEYNRRWYAANRDYALLRDQARREKNRERAQCPA